jgi:hypothetical protein
MVQVAIQFCADRVAPEKQDILTCLPHKLLSGTITGDSIMKLVPLTQGKFAKVDDEDYDNVMRFIWHAVNERGRWYACCTCYLGRINKKSLNRSMRLARLIMIPPKNMDVDHIDGDSLNNQRSNLRICNRTQNLQNQRPIRGGTSQYKGVCFSTQKQKWRAYINVKGKQIHLGFHNSEQLAAEAYNKGAIKYFGEFAKLNLVKNIEQFPPDLRLRET